MRIYIVEDDISVISILEDIVESNDWGPCAETAEADWTWIRSWHWHRTWCWWTC